MNGHALNRLLFATIKVEKKERKKERKKEKALQNVFFSDSFLAFEL